MVHDNISWVQIHDSGPAAAPTTVAVDSASTADEELTSQMIAESEDGEDKDIKCTSRGSLKG